MARTPRRLFWSALVTGIAVGLVCLPMRGQETGETLYKSKCAMCHGPDGAGKTAMGQALKVADLRSDDVQKMEGAALEGIVSKGKNKMPAYEGKLTKEQIDKLVAYIRSLAKH